VFIALHSRQSVIKAHVLLVIQYASSLQVGAFWSVIWSVMADVATAAARSANTPPRRCDLGGAAAESSEAHWSRFAPLGYPRSFLTPARLQRLPQAFCGVVAACIQLPHCRSILRGHLWADEIWQPIHSPLTIHLTGHAV
jgi:hypothetical protein